MDGIDYLAHCLEVQAGNEIGVSMQLGQEAAAAGITGDQLQAALELAARVPLRVVAVPDSDAGGGDTIGSGNR